MQVSKRLSPIPSAPKNDALPIGRNCRNPVHRAGCHPQPPVRAGILRHQLIVHSDANHRSLFRRQQYSRISQPWQSCRRRNPPGPVLPPTQLQILHRPGADFSISVHRNNAGQPRNNRNDIRIPRIPHRRRRSIFPNNKHPRPAAENQTIRFGRRQIPRRKTSNRTKLGRTVCRGFPGWFRSQQTNPASPCAAQIHPSRTAALLNPNWLVTPGSQYCFASPALQDSPAAPPRGNRAAIPHLPPRARSAADRDRQEPKSIPRGRLIPVRSV